MGIAVFVRLEWRCCTLVAGEDEVRASSPSEIADLLLIISLTPITIVAVRQMTHPGRWWMLYGFLGVGAAGVLAVAENLVPFVFVAYVKELCFAFAGIAYTVGFWQLSAAMRSREFM